MASGTCFCRSSQFDLAFVGEEDEAVFLRERFALVDELDEVTLLGVGEFVGGVAGHGKQVSGIGIDSGVCNAMQLITG